MKSCVVILSGALAATLVVPMLITSSATSGDRMTLAGTVPNDVFLFAAQRHSPEPGFLDRYWGEVFDALADSGVGNDLIDLFTLLLDEKQSVELERIKNRMSRLIDGVDWQRLPGQEFVFAERFDPPESISDQHPPLMMANLIFISRGSVDGVAENYAGLVEILEAIVEEINKAAGTEGLAIERYRHKGANVASVNLLAMVPGAPQLPLSVAKRDDILIIAFREHLFADTLDLMDGGGSKKPIGDDPRFKSACAKLPPAGDSLVFFDAQALLNPLRSFLDTIVGMIGMPGDVILNTGNNPQANNLTAKALNAYRRGDFEKALALTEQAYEVAPEDSIVNYNMACFSALSGKQDKALVWLRKAVEQGFHAPKKITADSDLRSLRDHPKFKAAVDLAAEMAGKSRVKDVVLNSASSGEVVRLRMQVRLAYEKNDYEQGLKLIEQAYAIAPRDSQVLYIMGCLHTLLGHEDKGLEHLEQAVEAGFYCPKHIAKDSDWKSVRDNKRFKTVLHMARDKAAKQVAGQTGGNTVIVKHLIERVADAIGILDCSATVMFTEGYSVRTESVTLLVDDARDRPIYPVIARSPCENDFARYLPQETNSFQMANSWDLSKLYEFLEDSLRTAGPQGEELLKKWGALQEEIGCNLQRDVFDWIDGAYISVTLADGAGDVLFLKVTDEQLAREKISAALAFVANDLPGLIARRPMFATLAMLSLQTSPAQHPQLEGFENIYFAISPQPTVWGVTDGYLIFGTTDEAVALCLATAKGEYPGIRENSRVMSEALIPTGPYTSVSLIDQRGMGEELAEGIGIATMVTGMLGASVPDPQARSVVGKITGMLQKLTPVVRKIDFYKSTASYSTFDGQMWQHHAVTHYFSPEERGGGE